MNLRELFKAQKYGEVIDACTDLSPLGEWDLYWLCRSYYKLEEYDKLKEIYEIYLSKNPKEDRLKIIYLWSIYKSVLCLKNSCDVELYIVNEAADYILNQTTLKEQPMLWINTVFKIVDLYKSKNTVSTNEKAYEYLKLLDPDLLSTTSKIAIVKEREKEVHSDKEKWYAYYTKICCELEHYEECIEYSNKALKEFNYNHTENDYIFLKYRIAKSLMGLKYLEEAIKIVEELNMLTEAYYIKSLFADLYFEKGDIKKAYFFYYSALLSPTGELKAKIKLIKKVADMQYEDNDLKKAKLHYQLIKKIREQEGWSIDRQVEEKLIALNEIDINNVEKQCRMIWLQEQAKYLPQAEGTISKIIANNKGFITYDSKQIFFMYSDIIMKHKENILHKKVKFNIINTYDRKKQQKATKAINIRIIE